MTWDYDGFAPPFSTTSNGSITAPPQIVFSSWAGVTFGPTHPPEGDGMAPVPAIPQGPRPTLPPREAEA